ncbi:hypothetical protein DFR67_11090 [Williamsia limnetica]|uniref:Uncharacterized protein n=1 Tax=Williamsia limnetica TaxID=882452 RepID=A0A318RJH3_WILLI|nr:hypothetical protein [Williamsia limnetica]PYE15429.1 hypothetical protein DFR67_11090 [Williamsia limnetica]
MSTTNSSTNDSLRRNLIWLATIIAVLLTAMAIYDIANGERNVSVWLSIVCWPIVAILNGVQLYRLNRRP